MRGASTYSNHLTRPLHSGNDERYAGQRATERLDLSDPAVPLFRAEIVASPGKTTSRRTWERAPDNERSD